MKFKFTIAVLLVFFMVGCGKWIKHANIFPISQDVNLGYQVSQNFDQENSKIILDSAKNVEVYKYLYGIRDSILNTQSLIHVNDFTWRLRIIKDDTTQNAFCTPGGYIYVYTGLIKYLESEDQLAGVMGHEMAHAEKRHSTDAMTREFGIDIILKIAFEDSANQLANIGKGLTQLKYGRDAETEADMCSVEWLYKTSYNAVGAAGFFEKIEKQGNTSSVPEFLSTHPNPNNRIANMKKRWQELGGKTGKTYTERYKAFQKWFK
jgi:predicted Zn-dependent protease